MTQTRATDDPQLSHMVAWLDEQRKQDKDQLLAVQQDVQRIGLSVRELTAHITKVAEDLSQSWSKLGTLAPLEEGLRQTREMLLIVQQRVDEGQDARGKEVLLRHAEAERDHRTLVDLGQQILEMRKLIDAEDGKIRSLVEEVKRSRGSIEMVPAQIEGIDKSVSGVDSRVRLIEELTRRQENRLTLAEKAVEVLHSDHTRMVQWQQAAELRWSRQLATWQQQMEEWQREAEDRVKLVQQFIKQIASVKEEVQAVRLTLADVHKRAEDHAAEMLRVEGLRTHDREEIRRVEQAAEVQRRRIDEQAGNLKQLQEQFLQDIQELGGVATRVDAANRRIEEVSAQASYLDQRLQRETEGGDQLRKELRELNQRIEQHIQHWLLQAEDDRRRLEEIMEETHRLNEQQKLREIAELEHQITEIRERFSKVRTS